MKFSKDSFYLFIFLFFLLIDPQVLFSQSSQCLECHSDKDLTYTRNHKEISLYVDAKKFQASVHGDLDCTDCHEGFNPENIPHKKGKNILQVDCGNCHSNKAAEVKNDIHHRLKKKIKHPPTCQTCHGSHYIKSPSEFKNPVKQYCSRCHNNIILKEPFHNNNSKINKECAACHDVKTFNANLKLSVHKNLICSDCHVSIANRLTAHENGDATIAKVNCDVCHKQVEDIYRNSIHGVSLEKGIDEAAKCWNCHGSHKILTAKNPKSTIYPQNIPSTCGKCHGNPKFKKKFLMVITNPIKTYKESVHGRLLAEKKKGVPTCITCHGSHDIKSILQAGSKISPFNIPNTCGVCHKKQEKNYKKSIHWLYAEVGVKIAPVCNDCHNEHDIQSITGKNARFKERILQEETCVVCHQNKKLAQRFGIKAGAPRAYLDSYHGLAGMRGDQKTAMCVDCHGVHKILPKNYSASTINTKNIVNTCKKCHKNATLVFAESYSHYAHTPVGANIEKIVKSIYFWLIIIVIGGMLIHNIIIYLFEVKKKRVAEKGLPSIPRFTENEVIQHFLLLLSFSTLAITGFALKFPHSFLSDGLLGLGISETIRQYIHRTAAVIMIVTGIYHIFYLFTTERGRAVLSALLPRFKDIQAIRENLSYYLHLSKKEPAFAKYDYAEKAEYWALIWGTILMGATGFILWFPTTVGNWAPTWLIQISQIIHFYEAILATLAILVWHFFFVMFRPTQYPMSFAWIDGQIPLDRYKHHHKEHFQNIVLEWIKLKDGKISEKEISNDLKVVLDNFKKRGEDPNSIFKEQIYKDNELKVWLKDKLGLVDKDKLT